MIKESSSVKILDIPGLLSLIQTPRYKQKSRGELRTPAALINEILDQIPQDIWRRGGAFLDPCCGRGSFLVAVARRLLKYHSPEKVSGMLYGIDIDPWCVYTTKTVLANHLGVQENHIHVQVQDFLQWKPSMRFDTIVGNPPYQIPNAQTSGGANTLWKQFTARAFELVNDQGYVGFVTPNIPYYNQNFIGEKFRKWQTLAVWTDMRHHFPGVGSQFTTWIVQNTPNHTTTRVVDLGFDIDLSQRKYPRILPPMIDSILDKIELAKSRFGVHPVTKDSGINKNNTVSQPDADHPYRVRWGSVEEYRYAATRSRCYDQRRVMVLFSGNPKFKYFSETDLASSAGGMSGYILVKDATQGQNFIDQMELDINKFERQVTKNTGAFTNEKVWQRIAFPLDRPMSNQESFDLLGLTPDEIAMIKSTLSK